MITWLRIRYAMWRSERHTRRVATDLIARGILSAESWAIIASRIDSERRWSVKRQCAVIAAMCVMVATMECYRERTIAERAEARARNSIMATVDAALDNSRWN